MLRQVVANVAEDILELAAEKDQRDHDGHRDHRGDEWVLHEPWPSSLEASRIAITRGADGLETSGEVRRAEARRSRLRG